MSQLDAILKEASELTPSEQQQLAERLLTRHIGEALSAPAPQIPGQVEGYWFAEHQQPDAFRPLYRCTGAVLPVDGRLGEEGLALDLVLLEGAWYPLSEGGLYAYAHTSALLRGERYRFIVADRDWPQTAFAVELAEPLAPEVVTERYGHEAGLRSRPSYLTVQLRLHRIA